MEVTELESILEDDGIVFLTYGGFLSQALIVGMTEALEKESEVHDLSMKVSHNILTTFIELSQNMMNYAKRVKLDDASYDPKGLIVVGHKNDENRYFVFSRNIVTTAEKEKIIPKIEAVLPLNKDELKTLYRELRKSGKGKHEKGAGIGFIEIARRSSSMEYEFSPIDDDKHYFALKVLIDNN